MRPISEIKIVSFGYKYGDPPRANLLFDVRFIKNPHYVAELQPLTGADGPVKDYVLSQDSAKQLLVLLATLIREALSGYVLHGHEHEAITIAVGCTGGKHRSVCFAIAVAAIVTDLVHELSLSSRVQVEHRDLGRE